MKDPLFILGCPRSGTTLLASLLKYTSYGPPVETHFITKYYKRLHKYGDLTNKNNAIKLIRDILKERPVMQWKLDVDPVDIYDNLDEISFRSIVNSICMMRSLREGFETWGDKTPHYILDLEIIYRLFPKSKYIYIVRDGRDVALSLLKKEWGPNNVYSCAEYWVKCNRANQILDNLKKEGQLFFLKYEDLLEKADKILPEIYLFLNEPYFEDKMDKLIAAINRKNYNKWKTQMKPKQIKIFENIAANTLKRFGYETSYDQTELNKLLKYFYKAHNEIIRAVYLFKINVIDGIKIKYFGKEPFAE